MEEIEIVDFVNADVRRSRDGRCLALVDGERMVHLDGTPEFFDEMSAGAAEVAGTLRANDCGNPMEAARRHISRVLSMIAESDVLVPESGRLSWSCGGIDCHITVFADSSGAEWLGVLAKGATAKKRAKAVKKANAINASHLNQVNVLAHRKDLLVVGEIPIFPWLQATEVKYLIERVAGTTRKIRANF